MSHYKVISMQAPHCGQCGMAISLDHVQGEPMEAHKFIVGSCQNSRCGRNGIRLEIPLTATRCMVSRDGTHETNHSH